MKTKNNLEMPEIIEIVDGDWVEIKYKGNRQCPECKEKLVIAPLKDFVLPITILGFCIKCKKPWGFMPKD